MDGKQRKLEGIGGWLVLVAIGMVVAPIWIVMQMLATYPPIFSAGIWESLTTAGSPVYNPYWAPILLGEISVNMGMLIAWLYIAYLFFSKKSLFPKWYISVVVFNLVFIIADAFAIKLVLPDEPVFDPDTGRELMRSVLAVLIWVPYMLVSKRVQNTFVNA